jgi:hypothetical protein
VYHPSKIVDKIVNKNAIKHQKGVPSQNIFTTPIYPSSPKIFTTPVYPSSPNLGKTSWTLPLDFQTVCIIVYVKYSSLKERKVLLVWKTKNWPF